MGNFFSQIKNMIDGLSLVRKISILAVIVLSVGVIGYLVHVSNQASYEPVFTNLNSDDIGSIISQLDRQGVSYKVDQNMRTVLVPTTKVLEVRMKLAEEGIPRFGGIGFELFDKEGFGRSDFEQRVNYQRALEGELTRTIRSLREVESARIHLVLPEKSLFSESQQPARASVILKLGRDGALSRNTVNAISHLVSSSVDGLSPDDVTIVDSLGRLLSAGGQEGAATAGRQVLDQKMQLEKTVEQKIVDLLSPVVGMGKVMARVAADIDFTQVESTDEIVDPTKTAVAQESRSNNAKTAQGSTTDNSGENSKEEEGSEQVTYQISKSIRKQMTPMGNIKKLSIAILVDGNYETATDGKKTYKARAPEELKKLEDLAKSAVGFSQDRGDQIKVDNIAFQNPEEQLAESQSWYEKKNTYSFLVTVIGNVLLVLTILLVIFFVIRPLQKSWATSSQTSLPGAGGVPLLQGEVLQNMGDLIRTNPTAAAETLRKWLQN